VAQARFPVAPDGQDNGCCPVENDGDTFQAANLIVGLFSKRYIFATKMDQNGTGTVNRVSMP
jgi:hypothetical protein